MNTKDHQDGETQKAQPPHDLVVQTSSVDETRRRLTKSGFAISGVILTLASRPVLGDLVCQSPSGLLSGNVSAHGTPQTCTGLSAGYWGTHAENWPSPYVAGTSVPSPGKSSAKVSDWSGGSIFSDVFNCNGYGSIYIQPQTIGVNTRYTMMQVIWLGGGGDPHQLGAHIVSALLNARSGRTPVLTEAQVKNIFNEWNLRGYFEPTAGVKWYAADIVDYLKTTMTL